MASREKKVLSRKSQTASPIPAKEVSNTADADQTETVREDVKATAIKAVSAKTAASKANSKIQRKLPKRNILNRSITKKGAMNIKLKPKAKKSIRLTEITQNLSKALSQNVREIDKKKIVRNGLKTEKVSKAKASKTIKNKDVEENDKPPVLEPIIFPENNTVKKTVKKRRVAKKALKLNPLAKKIKPELDDCKIKQENDDTMSIGSDLTDASNMDSPRPTRKRVCKKIKTDIDLESRVEPAQESLDDVMNQLNLLIKSEDIKKEQEDETSSTNTETSTKPKRLSKKKVDSERRYLKKGNLENTLHKLDTTQRNVIDRLDLNVRKISKVLPMNARRHSIERMSADNIENKSLRMFATVSAKSRRGLRIQHRIDAMKSPYSTRSDTSNRLRNGKHRSLKSMGLLPGNALPQNRRKRLYSEMSSTDINYKLEYESDSSFSDLSSINCGESGDCKDKDLNNSVRDTISETIDSVIAQLGADDLSTEKSPTFDNCPVDTLTDSNSNLCDKSKKSVDKKDKKSSNSMKSDFSYGCNTGAPSLKVPEKNFILDSMKFTFNEVSDDTEKRRTSTTSESESKKVEPVEEIKEIPSFDPIEESLLKDEEPMISPITKEINKADELKLDEIISKLEEAMDTEEITTPQTNDVLNSSSVHDSNEFSFDESVQNSFNESVQNSLEESVQNSLEESVQNSVEESVQNNLEESVQNNLEKSVPNSLEESVQNLTTNTSKMEDIIESNLEPVDFEKNESKSEIIDKSDNVDVSLETTVELPELNGAVEEDTTKIDPEFSVNNTSDLQGELNGTNIAVTEIEETDKLNDTKSEEENISGPSTQRNETVCDVMKEDILHALGLRSLKDAEEEKLRTKAKSLVKTDSYTGTLKTVIKLNRENKNKKGKNPLKITLQKSKGKTSDVDLRTSDDYKIMKEGAGSWKQGGQSSDTAGTQRKSHYSNRSNMDGSSEHTSDGETGSVEGNGKSLVIPEKASSFGIHPDRLCKDECSYCFGKFGLFDTPCHIAQIKSFDRQDKILNTEKQLTRDSCLCDACYRHIDRKANAPSYMTKSFKRSALVAPGPRENHCHVLGCGLLAANILRRKWIIKMRKSICKVINIDLDNPGLHSIPICEEHFAALEHLMVCAMCKRRLAKNHIHYLGPETVDLNESLKAEGIPITLSDKPVVCKLCKFFATLSLKDPTERPENTFSFYSEYKKRLLHFNDIVPMDEAAAEEPLAIPTRDRDKNERERDKDDDKMMNKKKKKPPVKVLIQNEQLLEPPNLEPEVQISRVEKAEKTDENRKVPSSDSHNNNQNRTSGPESPSDMMIDYKTLIPSIAMDCESDNESNNKIAPSRTTSLHKILRPESVKEAIEISKIIKLQQTDKNSDIAVQKLGANPSISVRQLFPGEEDLPLQTNIEFGNVRERTPEGWERCASIIQYDMHTKQLWQELQKPYGNQSSFIRHLILLEKYFRNGDLILSPTASHHAANYSESVQNRLKAYDNIPTNAGPMQPISMLPFNKSKKSNTGVVSSASTTKELHVSTNNPITVSNSNVANYANIPKNTPITLTQLTSPPAQIMKTKPGSSPPGLISIHPGTVRPVGQLVRVPQSQKIKFPITKNWRPNLIPIDPTKKMEKTPGLVQVISGGKPYHITLEDYKKMCAIKRSFELKQKRVQEAQVTKISVATGNGTTVLRNLIPSKGLIISKAQAQYVSPKPETSVNEARTENSLEKLDQQVEKLGAKLNESSSKSATMCLPKIPKSLTIIPQTVTRKTPSRPTSPALLITPKHKLIPNKS